MEVNKISQIIALCDSIPVMLDTKILDAESAIKTLALIRQLAEEAEYKHQKVAKAIQDDFNSLLMENFNNTVDLIKEKDKEILSLRQDKIARLTRKRVKAGAK